MKTAIVYMSKHGTTEKVVRIIAEHLTGFETRIFNLRNDKSPDIASYDFVIIGGSIHAGRIQKRVRDFCQKNMTLLTRKKLGLFLCCMETGEKATLQFSRAFAPELRQHAFYTGMMGGECLTEKMNFLEKRLVKLAVGGPENYPTLNDQAINTLLRELDGFKPFQN